MKSASPSKLFPRLKFSAGRVASCVFKLIFDPGNLKPFSQRESAGVRENFTSATRLTLLLALASLWALSALAAPTDLQTNLPAWPAPPAEPYIVFERAITGPRDIGVKPSAFIRFANWITGEKAGKRDLKQPFGLSLDEKGNLLVTDAGSGEVCFLDLAGKKWTAWKNIGPLKFSSPVAAVRHGETFIVADSALGAVIAFDAKGRLRFALTNGLERPAGLALHGDKLFIADSQRHEITVCGTDGKIISRFGQRGSGPGEFNFPTHLATDQSGRLYVTDAMNYRVQIFDVDGKFLRAFGGVGDGPGRFSRPKGVAVDSAGHVYVVDALFDNVQIFDAEARLLLDWGGSGSAPGQFWLPNAIAINSRDEIFVADSYNHRIQIFRYTGKQ